MKYILRSIQVAALAFAAVSCSKDPGVPGGGSDTPPVVVTVTDSVINTGLTNLSGLCYNYAKTGFMAARDNGKLYELSLTGQIVRTLPYSGSNDFEGITINPTSGAIYLADEGNMEIWRLAGNEKSVAKVTDIVVPGVQDNKGIEGVAYGRDTLYIVNQTPARLIKYSLAAAQEVWHKDLFFATYFSDICYDDTDHTLWIVDSKKQKVFHCDLNGVVIASQDIAVVPKAEALVVDRSKGGMWVGCDETGKIFRFKLLI